MKLLRLLFLLGTLLLVCGCGQNERAQEATGTQQTTEEAPVKIGLCFDTFVVERWQRDRDIFVSTASELGADVHVQNANGDVKEQIRQINHLIDEKVDVLVIVPIDADSLTEVINRARNKSIPVICYDRLVNQVQTDLYISFDNETVGHLMGIYLGKNLTVGDKVLMISGPVTDGNVLQVNKGFEEEMEKAGIEVADIAYMDEWKAEHAYEYVNQNIDWIRDDISGIMCGNDNLASQVIYALSENRLAGDILVTGQDADLDACQRIVEKTQAMTVYKPVGLLAEQAAQAAVKLGRGENVTYDETIWNGKADIPYIRLMPESVTAENIDETIIKSGFHQKEDVYINCPQ